MYVYEINFKEEMAGCALLKKETMRAAANIKTETKWKLSLVTSLIVKRRRRAS